MASFQPITLTLGIFTKTKAFFSRVDGFSPSQKFKKPLKGQFGQPEFLDFITSHHHVWKTFIMNNLKRLCSLQWLKSSALFYFIYLFIFFYNRFNGSGEL